MHYPTINKDLNALLKLVLFQHPVMILTQLKQQFSTQLTTRTDKNSKTNKMIQIFFLSF